MSPRHGLPKRRRAAALRARLYAGVVVLLTCAGTALVVGSLTASPARPHMSPTLADPAFFQQPARTSAAPDHASRSEDRSTATTTPAPARTTPARRPTPRPAPRTTAARAPNPAPAALPAASTEASMQQQVLDLVNTQRANAGCKPLTLDTRLHDAAEGHSQDMVTNDYFSHTGSDGSSPWDRAHAAGYADPSGENIAIGYRSAQDVMTAWMNSQGHRENILNCDSKEMGVGYVVDPNRGPAWTQMFGFG